MNRRQWLVAGASVAALGAVARYVVPPPTTRLQRSRSELAAFVCESLDPSARERACLAYDHPLRQYHNRGLALGGVPVHAGNLGWEARRALTDLVALTLSPAGMQRALSQFPTMLTGVNFLYLLVFGEPRQGPFQLVLSSVHLNLRLGGTDAQGAAFGGPQVYGDQRGNERVGLPGNRFRHQMLAAQALRESLSPAQRAAIRRPQAPPQTCIALQGADGQFDGLPVGELPLASRRLADRLVDSLLDTYSEGDAEAARQCLERNGGSDALRFADYDIDYQGGRRAGDGASQIFRLEGPAAVFHFRGEPHLHAFINIAADPGSPLSVGELLADNPAALSGEDLRRWFEAAMREQAQADFSHYPPSAVVGRLRAGPVRTGDLWAAESWNNNLAVCQIRGEDLAAPLVRALKARGTSPRSGSLYRVAVPRFFLGGDVELRLGKLQSTRIAGPLRDVFSAHARQHGFRASA